MFFYIKKIYILYIYITMGGGLMQLVAYGAQDVYLTGNPQITFFKVVYRRHTNFSIESIKQVWQGDAVNGDKTAEAIISRNGDLVCGMHIELNGTGITDSKGRITTSAIKDIELQIGGQKIDKQTGAFMSMYQQLTDPRYAGGGVNPSAAAAASCNLGAAVIVNEIYIPLQFWFCRNPGLALPLIALQYHEVKVILNTTSNNFYDTEHTSDLYADYIYLDTDERKRFAQVSHEYLIEQVQYRSFGSGKLKFDIGFINHPVKELLWINGRINNQGYFWNNKPASTNEPRKEDIIPKTKWKLRLNGHDRFSERWTSYFTRKQVADYHSGGLNSEEGVLDKVAIYSFALKPEEHQPSGTCNFSRIDSAELLSSIELKTSGGDPLGLEVYAINYNVLRVMSGMGGLAYSN